jgi:tripartite-type tricarboxylate transporter receptor subunit TctC
MLDRRQMMITAGAGLLGGMAGPAFAQSWPARPVTITVPFPPTSASDIIARALGEYFRTVFNGTFIVENRPGATGNIAVGVVAKSQPDGHSLLVSTSGPVATNVLTFKNLAINPTTELTPIGLIAEIPGIICVKGDLPMKTIKDLIDYDTANPGKLTFGHPGVGTFGHMAGEMLATKFGRKFTWVPYQGSPPLIRDLAAGIVDVAFDIATVSLPLVAAGQIKAIAAMAGQRIPEIRDVPTVTEQGIAGLESSAFVALLAPAGLPPDLVQKLNAALNAWLGTDDAKKILKNATMRALGGSQEDLRASVKREIERWEPVVKAANIQLGN